MIATVRGLIVLGAIAALLALALVVLGPRDRAREDRTLAPSLTASAVSEVVIARPGQPAIRIARHAQQGWRWIAPVAAKADAAPLDALFAALRGGRWHRRAAARAGGSVRGELAVVTTTGQTLRFGVGAELAGAEQTWIVHGDHALLVDSWVARALVPDPLALRERVVFAGADQALGIRAGPVAIEGPRMTAPHPLWLAVDRLGELHAALDGVVLVSLDGMVPGPRQVAIRLERVQPLEVVQAGTCAGDRILLASNDGDGCVERAAWQRVVDALAALDKPAAALVDRRPVPVAPRSIVLPGGVTLDLAGQPRIDGDDADPERIAELFAALGAEAEPVARPTSKPTGTIVVRHDARALTLELFDGTLVRDHEPVALRPSREAWAVITRPAAMLRDPVLWREDATTIRSIAVDGVTYTRGAVLGEWTRAPGGSVDAALVEALAASLATVRAPRSAIPERLAHTVKVTFAPPTGASRTHELAIGAPSHGGCPARVDGAPVQLDLALCTAVHAVVASR